MDPVASNQVIEKALRLGEFFNSELALGISGSYASGTLDKFSDVDICVIVEGCTPSRDARLAAYDEIGFIDPIYFDVDFNTSLGDGFVIDGVRCDFNWMVSDDVRIFLGGLGTDFDCPEWLPGGLAMVKTIHDPNNLIANLKGQIPTYPSKRSRYRAQQGLQDAYYSLYTLEWLPKAAHRQDTFSFLKYQYLLLEKFFYAIFALNRVWFSEEKRLFERVLDFDFVPDKAAQSIRNVDVEQNLDGRLREIELLFCGTVDCVHQVYPDLILPIFQKVLGSSNKPAS